ncbi:MAG: glutamate-5-semialdehyde dehydrogenase [Planctomycetota bacterium]|nr:glutamate-5-semialdehyde dehydrogenase [Planctomycetota bacterium]
MDIKNYAQEIASKAKNAVAQLANLSTQRKNDWLLAASTRLLNASDKIRDANQLDLSNAKKFSLSVSQIDRLTITPKRLTEMAHSMVEIASLEDPIGRVLKGGFRPNGLQVLKVGVPLGVLFFIYESRPNVTSDAAALSFKSGNAIILRGGKEALNTNKILVEILQAELINSGLPIDAIQLVQIPEREVVGELLLKSDLIDLVIPRGGKELIKRVSLEATMPVMKHFDGNCHIYVETSADLEMAAKILVNSKCQRPGVCNAAESLLIDQKIAHLALPVLHKALIAAGVEVRGCPLSCSIVSDLKKASEQDFSEEFLDLIISVKIVTDIDDAIRHINKYGSKHTDVIVTSSLAASQQFVREIDSAAVIVNASSRFNDGGQIGLGAEIGISTDKYHARGPCGLNELTSYKYVIMGNGNIRQD